MNALITNMANQRSKELRDYAGKRRLAGRRRFSRSTRPSSSAAGISIRRLDVDTDAEALERLAGRDSAATPSGDVIGAERDGRLVAAVSLSTGELVADPFTPSATEREMLQRRAGQLAGDGRRHSIRRHGFHLSAHPRRG